MDSIPAIIFGIVFIIYGIFVFNGKLLWFLKMYKYRFKDEQENEKKRKAYKTYGIIFMVIGLLMLVIGSILYSKGIITTKTGVLH